MNAPAKLSPRGAALAAASKSHRNALIGKIHIAKKQLDMAEESYRALLLQVTGKTSLTDCHEGHLDGIVRRMVSLGFQPTKPRAAKPAEHRKLDMAAESKKIRAVWLLLHELGAVNNPAEGALAVYCKRITGVDDLSWLNDKQALVMIETLKKWAVRVYPDVMKAIWLQLHSLGLKPAFTEGALEAHIRYHLPVKFADRKNASFETMRRAHFDLVDRLPKGEQ